MLEGKSAKESGTEKIDRGGGAVEQEGTEGEGDEEQEVDRA